MEEEIYQLVAGELNKAPISLNGTSRYQINLIWKDVLVLSIIYAPGISSTPLLSPQIVSSSPLFKELKTKYYLDIIDMNSVIQKFLENEYVFPFFLQIDLKKFNI